MSETGAKLKKVLFVDDNLQFLEMIERVMGGWSQGEWQIFIAQNSGKALLLLQEHAIDLVVVDIQMPVVDGIQFLALLHRKYPDTQKVTLSAYADDASRAACLNHGAELFLEKPRNPGDLEIIFGTLRELARQEHVATGFRGVLRQVSLEDVIQMECLNKNSSILEVAGRNWQGRIYVFDGAIIHAEAGDRNGEAALNKILSLKGGEFNLRAYSEPPQRSIDGAWEFLLMEAARVRDEATEAEREETLPVDEVPPESELPPLLNSASPLGAPPASRPSGRSKPPPLPPLPPAPAIPRPASPARAPEVPPSPTVSSSASVGRASRIDEMLVCTPRGEVLYEWKCGNTSERISFLEFLSQKSSQLGEGLNLGPFDRLEMEGERSRIVAQIKSDRGLFVRTTKGTGGPE